MKHKIIIITFFLLTPAIFFSCKNKADDHIAEDGTKTTFTCSMHPQVVSETPGTCPICAMDLVPVDKSNTGNFLMLSEPQRLLANITTDTVQTGSFDATKRLNAKVVTNPMQTEVIAARVAGRLEKLFVREVGVPVKKGQPLYKIYSEQLAALQQEFIVAVAQVKQFPQNENFVRLEEAARQKLLLYSQTKAQIDALAAMGKTNPVVTYYSPVNGISAEVTALEGEYVSEGSILLRVENYEKVWIEANIYANEAQGLTTGQTVQVYLSGREDEKQPMKIEFIEPALEAGTQMFVVRGSLENHQHKFTPGMQVIAELPSRSASNAITLPVDAVIYSGKGAHVWIHTGEGKYEPRKVETGTQNFDRLEIVAGVTEGEVVVVSGAFLLFSEYVLKKGTDPMQ